MAYNKFDKQYNKFDKFDKPYITLPLIDNRNMLELFNLSNQMDSQEILQFSMINQIPLYICNDTNSNNLIHSILQNDTKNKNEAVRLNIIKFLVNNEVNPDQPNKFNQTPLHIACKKQYHNICKYLIEECKVNINYKDDIGFTPLHYLLNGNTELIETNEIQEFIQPKNSDNFYHDKIKEIKILIWEEIKNKPFFDSLRNTIDYYINNMKEEEDSVMKDLNNKMINMNKPQDLIIQKEVIVDYSKKIDKNIKKLFNNFNLSDENDYNINYKIKLKKLIKDSCKEFKNKIEQQFHDDFQLNEQPILDLYNRIEFNNVNNNVNDLFDRATKSIEPESDTKLWKNIHKQLIHNNSLDFADNVINLDSLTFIGGSRLPDISNNIDDTFITNNLTKNITKDITKDNDLIEFINLFDIIIDELVSVSKDSTDKYTFQNKYKNEITNKTKHLEMYNEYCKILCKNDASDTNLIYTINKSTLIYFQCLFSEKYSYSTFKRLIFFDKVIKDKNNNVEINNLLLYNCFIEDDSKITVNLPIDDTFLKTMSATDTYTEKINYMLKNNKYLPDKKLYDLIYFLKNDIYITHYKEVITNGSINIINQLTSAIVSYEDKILTLLNLQTSPSLKGIHNIIQKTDDETNNISVFKFDEAFYLGLSYSGLIPEFPDDLYDIRINKHKCNFTKLLPFNYKKNGINKNNDEYKNIIYQYRPPYVGSIISFYENQFNKYYSLLKKLIFTNSDSYYRFINDLLIKKKVTDITTSYYLYYQFIVTINKLNEELINEYKKLINKYKKLGFEFSINININIDINYILKFMNDINGYIFLYYNYLKTSPKQLPKQLPKFLYNELTITENIFNYVLDDDANNIDLTDLLGGASINNNHINNEINKSSITDSTIDIDNIDENMLFNLYLNQIVINLESDNYTNNPTKDYLPPSIKSVLYEFYEINKLNIMKDLVNKMNTTPPPPSPSLRDLLKNLIELKGFVADTINMTLYLSKIIDELFKNQAEIILHNAIMKKIVKILKLSDEGAADIFNNTVLNISDDTLLSYSNIDFEKSDDEKKYVNNSYIFLNEYNKNKDQFKIYPFEYSNITLLKQFFGLKIDYKIIELLINNNASVYELDNELNPCISILFKNKHFKTLETLNNLDINYKKFNFKKDPVLQIKTESLNHINKVLNNENEYLKIFEQFVNPQYESIINIMSINENFGFNVMNYTQESFYMCFYLINEYITDNLLNFKDKIDKDTILNFLNIKELELNEVYLYRLYNDIPSNKNKLIVSNYINSKINEIENSINEIENNIINNKTKKNNSIIDNINKNIDIINQLKNPLATNYNINDKIDEINNKIGTRDIKNLYPPTKLSSPSITTTKDKKIIGSYESKVNDTCYICHWLRLFKDETNLSQSPNLSLIRILLKEQSDIQNNNINIDLINKFWYQTQILCNEYFDNPKYTTKNKPLSFINRVLIHLTKHVICFNIEFILRDLFFKNLKLKTNDFKYINRYINYILDTVVIKQDKTFINILYNELPAKFVQNSTNIFTDYEEKVNFEPQSIKEILNELFNSLIIEEKSELMTILTKNVANYFDSFVPKLINNWYVVMENVFKFSINQYRLNSINKLLK